MAGFVDQYPHLPGHLTEFKDGGLQLTKEVNPPATDSVLILGTAVDGPIMEPVKVDSQTFESVFGKIVDENGVPNGATLGQAFEEAWAGGSRDIRLMRVSGKPASYVLQGTATSRVVDTVFEGILGVATGNAKANSTFYTQDEAVVVNEVTADGVTLTDEQFTVTLKSEVPGKFTDGINVVDLADLHDVKIITGTSTIVEPAGEDIYRFDSDGTMHWAGTLPTDKTGYTLVLQAGIDYVVKGELDANQAFIDGATNTFSDAKADAADLIVTPLVRTKVALADNVCSNGSYVVIKYEDKDGNLPQENASDISGTFVATNAAQEFVLFDTDSTAIIPVEGLTKLYFDGVEYTELDTLADSTQPVYVVTKFTDVDGSKKAKVVLQPGKHAKMGARIDVRLLYKKVTTYIPEFKLETSFGGKVYNETTIQVDSVMHPGNFVEKIIKIVKPKAKRSQITETPLTYSSIDYPNFVLLARAINNDTKNAAFVKAIVSSNMEQTPTVKLNAIPTAKNFSGGEDGVALSKQDMFEALSGKKDAAGGLINTGAYQLLENYTVDSVVPAGVYADDVLVGKYDNFAYELALFCAISSYRNHTTLGFIQTTSPVDGGLKAVEDHVKKLEVYNNIYYMRDIKGEVIYDSDGKPFDLGRYINVVAGGDHIFSNTRMGAYACNSAAAFAGYVSTLNLQTAPTNKVVNYSQGLKFKYSNGQLERLTANRLVTFKYKGNGTSVAVVDAMTCAAPGSDYERLSSMRAVRGIANDIRVVADPFLGQPNTVQQRNALSALIDKKLGQHKEAGTIKDYSFSVIASLYDELVGQAKIELTLVPAQELRRITTIISLKPSL